MALTLIKEFYIIAPVSNPEAEPYSTAQTSSTIVFKIKSALMYAFCLIFSHVFIAFRLFSLGVVDFLTTEISTSKQKKFSLVTFVDTPGLVDGDMKYPFDVNEAITWLGTNFIYCSPLFEYSYSQGSN
jgi:hypothetical protein